MSTYDPSSEESTISNLLTTLNLYTTNLTTNVSTSISALTVKDYIRLIWIIGGYIFLRPYLDKGFQKLLNSANRKEEEKEKEEEAATAAAAAGGDEDAARKQRKELKRAKREVNALRGVNGGDVGGKGGDDDDDSESESDEEAEAQATGVPTWGKSARRRQKNFFKHLEKEAERMKEEEDDKDIEDLLED